MLAARQRKLECLKSGRRDSMMTLLDVNSNSRYSARFEECLQRRVVARNRKRKRRIYTAKASSEPIEPYHTTRLFHLKPKPNPFKTYS